MAEAQAIAELSREGFAAGAYDYPAGKTEPHSHDYDVCLHILSGEFRLGLVEEGVVRSFGPGERLLVPAGTLHFEDHDALRMVVGRRRPEDGGASDPTRGA
jgi:uncharacterized cupin superfamily protein